MFSKRYCEIWSFVAGVLIATILYAVLMIYFTKSHPGRKALVHRGTCLVNQSAGPIQVFVSNRITLSQVENKVIGVRRGGTWWPGDCVARSRVAILVPYRNRERSLVLFLNHMHPFLQRQMLEYTIFIIEQRANHRFNKGAIVNAGFFEVVARGSYDCFIINDVDVFPEDDRILYECADHPRHLATAVDVWSYGLLYGTLFGGAITFTRNQFTEVNGFSNAYFGWGGEDDDLKERVTDHGYRIICSPRNISRFRTLPHKRDNNMDRFYYFQGRKQRYQKDGLNSLQYKLISFEEKPLYTHIIIALDKVAIMKHVNSLMKNVSPTLTYRLGIYCYTSIFSMHLILPILACT